MNLLDEVDKIKKDGYSVASAEAAVMLNDREIRYKIF